MGTQERKWLGGGVKPGGYDMNSEMLFPSLPTLTTRRLSWSYAH